MSLFHPRKASNQERVLTTEVTWTMCLCVMRKRRREKERKKEREREREKKEREREELKNKVWIVACQRI